MKHYKAHQKEETVIRCSNVTHCDNLVNTRGHHVRLHDKLFCSSDCALEHADAERRLAVAANPFKGHACPTAIRWAQNGNHADDNDYLKKPPEHP